ncbi:MULTISPECIES: hypothetical protein [Janibacter]|uniref:Uncharacterized conserved protein YukE n=1 Tax=Janibacter indicus TaxID=857417 RepID=A0A1L3MHI8_9MICO|nr:MULTISPECIES: hypothetical protein [Janibacter]APH01752.1 hypothetical protein ASJ30_09625 [Janibacter indicus]QNF93091.1 hypothetical protein H7A72_09725 [Janibacter sp. YB324]SMC69204.1 Uncharacterized conserved protein YukE [Janibacter indicus]
MSVQEGMDVERVRQIASDLLRNGETLSNIGSQGRGQLSVLSGAWEGPDLESFSGSWGGAEKSLAAASQTVQALGKGLQQQASDQDQASQGGGGAPGGGGQPGGPGGSGAPGGGGGDDGFGFDDLAALGPLGSGIAALVTKGPRLLAALTGNTFKMYQALMPEARLQSMLGATASQMDDLFRGTIPAKISSKLGGLLRATGPTLGKVLGPLGVITGGIDLVQGIREGDYLRAAGGGLGALSGGLATAAAFGVALGPVGIGVMAVAGIAAAGIAIYQNWDAISGALSDAGGAIVDGAKAVGGAIADGAGAVADGAKAVADGVGSVLSDPVGAIGGLF